MDVMLVRNYLQLEEKNVNPVLNVDITIQSAIYQELTKNIKQCILSHSQAKDRYLKVKEGVFDIQSNVPLTRNVHIFINCYLIGIITNTLFALYC